MENHNRQNNIRIRDIPETVEHKDLAGAVTAIFNQLFQQPKDAPIELNKVHRTSGPEEPLFFLCPRYTTQGPLLKKVKEEIMRAASTQDSIRLNDAPVMLLLDLSRQSLAMRHSLKPLTSLLQEKHIKYQWRFPFQLRVHHEGKTALFHTLELPSGLLAGLAPPLLPRVSHSFHSGRNTARYSAPDLPPRCHWMIDPTLVPVIFAPSFRSRDCFPLLQPRTYTLHL